MREHIEMSFTLVGVAPSHFLVYYRCSIHGSPLALYPVCQPMKRVFFVAYAFPWQENSCSSVQEPQEQVALWWKPHCWSSQVWMFLQWYSPSTCILLAYSFGSLHCWRQQKWLMRADLMNGSEIHPHFWLCRLHLHLTDCTSGNLALWSCCILVENSFIFARSFKLLPCALHTWKLSLCQNAFQLTMKSWNHHLAIPPPQRNLNP